METRWWERFWKYKTTDNNQHDWFGIWADIRFQEKKNQFTMKQQTPLEEHDCTDFAKINCKCPVGYCKLKESSRTEEIAIGFSKWLYLNFWCNKGNGTWERFGKDVSIMETKTDSELFKDYMESIKH